MGHQHQRKSEVERNRKRPPTESAREDLSSLERTRALPFSPSTILRLQRMIGNQAVQRLIAQADGSPQKDRISRQLAIQRDPKPKVHVIDTPIVIRGGKVNLGKDIDGTNIARFIDNKIVGQLQRGWNTLITNYLTAIDNFDTYMHFSSESEAKADYLGTALKFGGEFLFKKAIEELGKKVPIVNYVSTAKEFYDKMMEEHDRAAKAATQVKVRNYIVEYRKKVTKQNEDYQKNFEAVRDNIEATFYEITKAGEAKKDAQPTVQNGSRYIAGKGGEYLNDQRKGVEEWVATIPPIDAFLQKITEGWVKREEGAVKKKGRYDYYTSGKIYVNIEMYRNGGKMSFKDNPPFTGQVAAEEGSKVADALNQVMKDRNIDIDGLDIEKWLTIQVEDEVDWGFNHYYTMNLRYKQPTDMRVVNKRVSPVKPVTVNSEDKILSEALRFLHANPDALKITKLENY